MKTGALLFSFLMLLCCLTGCGAGQQDTPPSSESAPSDTVQDADTIHVETDASQAEPPQELQEQEEETVDEIKKVRFVIGGDEIIVRLEDNPTADALYEMLPMDLEFADYNDTEKIAYPSETLPTEGSPDSCDPDVGDLCFYIPWGNLCFFYRDFHYSQSLVPLGTVESGVELLEQLDTVSSVMVEAAD